VNPVQETLTLRVGRVRRAAPDDYEFFQLPRACLPEGTTDQEAPSAPPVGRPGLPAGTSAAAAWLQPSAEDAARAVLAKERWQPGGMSLVRSEWTGGPLVGAFNQRALVSSTLVATKGSGGTLTLAGSTLTRANGSGGTLNVSDGGTGTLGNTTLLTFATAPALTGTAQPGGTGPRNLHIPACSPFPPAVRCVGRCDPLIPGPRERHQQRTKCSSVQTTSGKGPGSLQPPIPGSGTPSPRNRRRAILRAGRVCFGSALHWWLGLLRVFPVCNSEPGSVFGLITGDPDPRGYFPRSRGSRL
jgi:hypothetical protein